MIAASLANIERDTSIQCRAHIDVAVVNEYADCMTDGATFPPVVLFANGGDRLYIGDGWHRVMAAERAGFLDIPAEVHPGGRSAALKHALAANAAHGHRRTNADKRHCVEIALREFATLSSRAIAELCGVSDEFVRQARPQVPTVGTSGLDVKHSQTVYVTGADGKQYPAKRRGQMESPSTPTTRLRAGHKPRAERIKEIADLAETGHSPQQIAIAIGIGEGRVREIMAAERIAVPAAKVLGRSRRINPERVVNEALAALSGIAHGIQLIRANPPKWDANTAKQMLAEARESLRQINWLVGQLKEAANG